MDIHEYQAKEILSKFGVPIPRGGLAYSPEQAAYRATRDRRQQWVVKAQIHSGARGKAGGIKLCSTDDEIERAAEALLGKKLVTHQTGPHGKLVSRLYVEEATDIAKEIYLAFVIDRADRAHHGRRLGRRRHGDRGDLGQAARHHHPRRRSTRPSACSRSRPARSPSGSASTRRSSASWSDASSAATAPSAISTRRWSRSTRWSITKDKHLVALDAKMTFDDNALFRRPHIAELRDKSQEDPRETYATDRGLSYVGLDGDIGCIVNGAGLAMATMDMIKLAGGEPANFLDIGGGATPERVAKSFKAVLSDKNVEGDPRQHLRRHQPLRLGRRRASSRRSGAQHPDARWSCASPAPTSRRAADPR